MNRRIVLYIAASAVGLVVLGVILFALTYNCRMISYDVEICESSMGFLNSFVKLFE